MEDRNSDIIKDIEKYVYTIERELDESELGKLVHRNAIKRAFKNEPVISKIKLVAKILLNKIGLRFPLEVRAYYCDSIIRKQVQEIKNKLVLLRKLQETEEENKSIKKVNISNSLSNEKNHVSNICDYSKLQNGYIAIVVNSLDVGGVEQVVYFLATEFVRRGIHIKVMCLKNGGDIAEKLKRDGIDVLVFNGSNRLFHNYIRKAPPLLINTHFVGSNLKFFYKHKLPVVEVIHNMYVFQNELELRKERNNLAYRKRLIAVSAIVKDIYQKRVQKTDKIIVIGNSAAIRKKPAKDRCKIRQELHIPQDAFVLLNVGSIDSRKNQIGIVEAFIIACRFATMPLYLVFAGNVQDGQYEKMLMEKIKESNFEKQILILPYYDNVRELYLIGDVFVLDSFYEGWSIAATEALYDGLPVIHSECGSAYELVNGGKFGRVIPNPVRKIEEIDSELLLDKMKRAEYDNTLELVDALLEMEKEHKEWKEKRNAIAKEARILFERKIMINKYVETFIQEIKM